MKKKTETWVKPYHQAIISVALPFLDLYTRCRYHIKVEKCKDKRQLLILMNHQTAFDQFFVSMAFYKPIYYVASEDLFSKGWVSSLIRFLVNPIPIKKQATDLKAVMTCMKVAKEGGTIAMAPEGNRTFSGKTEYMNPALARLAAKLKLPIAIFRIEGGYGVHPRWADDVRKGKMRGYVSRIIEPKEYAKMSPEELYTLLTQELYVNEAVADACFYHKNSAEYIERAMYVCPNCGLSEFYSKKDITECKKCGSKIQYLPTKELKGVDREFPFRFINDWYEYQKDYVNKLNPSDYIEKPMYTDCGHLSEVILYDKKVPMYDVTLHLYGNRYILEGKETLVLPFDEISAVSVLGRNKINIYHGDKLYQIKSDVHFNALKYVNIYYRYKNTLGGEKDEQFLGL
ncbi:MAG: 1-acyl-sn-glycerol-3-phosphate acyltransferase [Lachnospiraceae bacterium]|nr:1-acyl-sn-glycerol-3-phosphate acyltransferase [Lachnospiraceae bacterium]